MHGCATARVIHDLDALGGVRGIPMAKLALQRLTVHPSKMFETLIHQHTDPLRDAYRNAGTRELRDQTFQASVDRLISRNYFRILRLWFNPDNPTKPVICTLFCTLSEPVQTTRWW